MAKKHSVHDASQPAVAAAVEPVEVVVASDPPVAVESGKRWRAVNGSGEAWEGTAETVEDVVRAFNATLMTGGRTFTRKSLTITELT